MHCPSLFPCRWGLAVEAALRNVLDGWIVDNQADAQLLRVRRTKKSCSLPLALLLAPPMHVVCARYAW